jgi:hypothetical protein
MISVRATYSTIPSKFQLPKDVKQNISKMVIKEIVTRTKSGVDINGATFTPYKKGGTPNLYKSGKLLRGLKTSFKGNNIVVEATNHADVGMYHNEGTKHLPRRRWFGISSKLSDDIFNIAKKYWAKRK